MSEEIKDIMDALENNELKNDGFWGRACSRLSQQLQACKEENETLTQQNKQMQMHSCPQCGEKFIHATGLELYEQNKQMRELISEINSEYSDDGILSKSTKYAIQQALKDIDK